MSIVRALRLGVALVALTPVGAVGQTVGKEPITFEWVFGDSGRRVASLPTTAWLSDGTLMIYDTRALIKAGKTFELMVYPMRKHDIGDREANAHLYRTMLEFWRRNL